ncbi:GPR1/FUN34/yaaH family-domain-containing protein [Irpex rosettiformis]|uniref:GPR1/FUN34/yaaH family-domain-containing protein n=1 Tax=Irpex rosettiformis TaxID=378272 RepID=A0ACB8U6L9_9APHY|nr:GPR1/FUN34/yaaH family-domain-containing protein [Irpex rosettiformis]
MSDIEKREQYTSEGVPTITSAHRPASKVPNRLGNPGPLGLFSFASTTLILSFYNCAVRGIADPNVVVGMALGVGGLAQLLAGMWEFASGNTFGATGFWLSFAALYVPGSGIADAYHGKTAEFENALGIYLITWFLVTFLLLIASLRRNLGLISLFFFLTITFMLLAISKFTGNLAINKAGGGVGILTALIAYYVGLAELLIRDESWFTLPLGVIPRRID